MGTVIPLPSTSAVSVAWAAYCAARARAEQSRRIEDGIAAGHAWRDWLALFEARP